MDITHQAKRYRIKSPDNTKKGAQAYEATLRRRLAEGKSIEGTEARNRREQTFKAFAEFWYKTHVVVHNKPSTISKAKSVLAKKLVPFFGSRPIEAITTLDIERYKAQQANRGLANKTINNELSILGKCLRDAKKWHSLTAIPEITPLKVPPTNYLFLEEEEAARLLQHVHGIAYEIVYVALKTGLRRGELQGLYWSDINLTNRTLIVRHNWCSVTQALLSPKGNRTRTIPLSNGVCDLLRRRHASDGFVFAEGKTVFDAHNIGAQLASASAEAGLPKVTLHVLRHTFASQLAMKGVSVAVIQKLLGHTDIKTTMRYAHLSQNSLIEAVRKLESNNLSRSAA
ncbi:MAG: tyrosine-type recombinase/integrase [Pseudomonadota bacterium]